MFLINLRDHLLPEVQCLLNQNRIIFRNQNENIYLPYYSNQDLNNISFIDQNNQSDIESIPIEDSRNVTGPDLRYFQLSF